MGILRASGVIVGLAAFAIAACSSSNGANGSTDPAACPDIGLECTTDAACCTKHCVMEGDKAYCQKSAGQCLGAAQKCTEDTQCCGGEPCVNGACAGGTATCQPVGGACGGDSSCCSGTCLAGACAAGPPTKDSGVTCAPQGAGCGSSADCCFSECVSNVCAGGGGTGPSGTCGASGSFCKYDSDCCTRCLSSDRCF